MDAIISLVEGQAWFSWITAIITAASAIAAATPTPQKGSLLAKVYSIIDFLAVNVGKAKEKSEDK